MNNDRCPVREAEIIHNSGPEPRARTLNERNEMIEEKAEELYQGWISGGDEFPSELFEWLGINGLGDILGDMFYGDNPQIIGNKLHDLVTRTLNELAVRRAEEWELEQ